MQILDVHLEVDDLPVQILLELPPGPTSEVGNVARALVPVGLPLVAMQRQRVLQLVHHDRRAAFDQKQDAPDRARDAAPGMPALPGPIRLLRLEQMRRAGLIPIHGAEIFVTAGGAHALDVVHRVHVVAQGAVVFAKPLQPALQVLVLDIALALATLAFADHVLRDKERRHACAGHRDRRAPFSAALIVPSAIFLLHLAPCLINHFPIPGRHFQVLLGSRPHPQHTVVRATAIVGTVRRGLVMVEAGTGAVHVHAVEQ